MAASVPSKSVTSHGWNEPLSAAATSAPSLAGRSRIATFPPPATMRSAVAFAIPDAPPTAMVRNPCSSMVIPSGRRGTVAPHEGRALHVRPDHFATQPPSTGSRTPVMIFALSDARKTFTRVLRGSAHACGGTAGVKRNSLSALPRWILYCVSGGRSASSFFATPMQSGHVVSLCG